MEGAQGMGPGITVAEDRRITPVGRFLRRTKLDELPQLINVLKGEMTFVGPRPEDPRYVAKRPELYRDSLRLQPGGDGRGVPSLPAGVRGIGRKGFGGGVF